MKTDALDAAGNTTAAIGKGFAIGSAALVSLALFGAFVTRYSATLQLQTTVNMLSPITFAFLIMGAMLPYWFTALTMKSVGIAAMAMVQEVRDQIARYGLTTPAQAPAAQGQTSEGKQSYDDWHADMMRRCNIDKPGEGMMFIVDQTEGANFGKKTFYPRPDYAKCIQISTDASLREMVPPGILVMCSPILVGAFFGVEAVSGLLAGSLVSSLQLAISASNSGGAWDNAKKYIEAHGIVTVEKTGATAEAMAMAKAAFAIIADTSGKEYENGSPFILNGVATGVVQKKGTDVHCAAVVGDTVGDPLKDTSGPALNIVMKLMAIISLVFCGFFCSPVCNRGQGIFGIALDTPRL